MLRAGRLLLPQGAFDTAPRRRAFPPDAGSLLPGSWRLPEPDLHRLADTSLCAGHLIAPPFVTRGAPHLWARETRARV